MKKFFFKPQSLRYQLFCWLILLVLPIFIIFTIATYFLANHYANLAYDKSLYRTALALSQQVIETPLLKGQKSSDHLQENIQIHLPDIAKDLLEYDEDDDIYFRIYGPNGDLVPTHTQLPLPKILPEPDKHLYFNMVLNHDYLRVVVFALPLTQQQGSVLVLVGETLTKRTAMADDIIATMLVPQLMMLLLVSVILYIAVGRGLVPLERLRLSFKKHSVDDLNPISGANEPIELKPLLDAFNELMASVKASVARQQRFVADAAHQLKTPLAGIKTQLDLALLDANSDASNTNQLKQSLNQARHASMQMSHMVTQLLSLTRAEPEAGRYLQMVNFDLQLLAQQVTAEWVPLALAKSIDLGFDSSLKTANIKGNAVLLRELINNLLDNAIRYTPEGGKITVSLNLQKQNSLSNTIDNSLHDIVLNIQDNGIGIAEKHQIRVFERFYRVLGTEQEGSGLGLTIVQEIAARHRAKVELKSEGEGKGTVISVLFPQ